MSSSNPPRDETREDHRQRSKSRDRSESRESDRQRNSTSSVSSARPNHTSATHRDGSSMRPVTTISTGPSMVRGPSIPTGPTIVRGPSIQTGPMTSRPCILAGGPSGGRDAYSMLSSSRCTSSTHPPRPVLNRDGMSGNPLTHRGVPEFSPGVIDNDNLDVADKGLGKGRKITKTTKEKSRIRDRVVIAPLPLQMNFNNPDAAKDISALSRVHYSGEFYWRDVSMTTRNLLWEQFGMRYCWNKKFEMDIQEVWDALNRLFFTRMLEKAKLSHKQGKRAKWLFPKYYRRLVKHWMSKKQMDIAARNSLNRRAKKKSDSTEGKAAPTYFGGSLAMIDYQRMVNVEMQNLGEDVEEVRPLSGPDLVSPLVFSATKSRNCAKFFDKYKTKVGEEPEPEEPEPIVPEWASHADQETVERYWQFVDEKWANAPDEKPRHCDPYDVECWNKAIHGAKKGRIFGLGTSFKIYDAGFGHRRPSRPIPQLTEDISNQIFEQVYETLATQSGLDSTVRMELNERMVAIQDHFHRLKKGKAPMQPSGSDGDDEELEYSDDE